MGGFVLAQGAGEINALGELEDRLKTMDDSLFYTHVTSNRNDFATWVRDIFGEEKLAAAMFKTKTRRSMLAVLRKHLHRSVHHRHKPKKIYHPKKRTIIRKIIAPSQCEVEIKEIDRVRFAIAEFVAGLLLGFAIGIFAAML